MQISRLFEIVYLLLERKSITAKELAERFEVSVRTIYRDIDSLSEAGIPIYASQGKGGGIALVEEYVLSKSLLSQSEQNEILYALQSLAAAKGPQADQVLQKLKSLFNRQAIDWIEVDFSPWGSGREGKREFAMLQSAILKRGLVEFEYINAKGECGSRKVEPQKLLFKVNAWYLQGYCTERQAVRHFKIARMANLRDLGESFEPSPGPEQAFSEQDAQTWIEVRLHIAAKGAHRVYDEFRQEDVEKLSDGSFAVAAMLPDSDWLIGYLLSFGSTLEVLSPPHLRDALRLNAQDIVSNYSKRDS